MVDEEGPDRAVPGLPNVGAEPAITVVTMAFEASDPDALLANLARYVVLARGEVGCRNVDLCASSVRPSRFVVVEKWAEPELARAHFDSEVMVAMAEGCRGILATAPEIELLDGLNAHDLA
jgi:quinol monooxygenase YgiN